MIYDSEPESALSHDAIDKLCLEAEDVEAQLVCPHRYSRSTRTHLQPAPPIRASEKRSSARQPSPQELAERAAVILALNVTSAKKHRPR